MKNPLLLTVLFIPFLCLSAHAQDASLQAGNSDLSSHNYKDAQTEFTKYINSFKANLDGYYKQQLGYDTSNTYMRTMHYASFKINHDWASGYYGLGMAVLGQGQKDDALQNFETAVKIDPTCANAYFQAGLLKKDKGDKTGSCIYIGKALSYNDTMKAAQDAYSNNFCWMCGLDYFKKGKTSLDLKEYADAVKNFRMATTICPDSGTYFSYLGMAYSGLNKNDSALDVLTTALKLDSTNYFVYYTRGVINQAAQKNNDAFNDLSKAIKLNPNALDAYIHRADVCEDMGNESSAAYDYQQIIRIKPSYGEAYYKIGLYRQKLGQDACSYFRKAADLGVDDAQPYVDDCNKASDQLQR